jgi:hypothetical protein
MNNELLKRLVATSQQNSFLFETSVVFIIARDRPQVSGGSLSAEFGWVA